MRQGEVARFGQLLSGLRTKCLEAAKRVEFLGVLRQVKHAGEDMREGAQALIKTLGVELEEDPAGGMRFREDVPQEVRTEFNRTMHEMEGQQVVLPRFLSTEQIGALAAENDLTLSEMDMLGEMETQKEGGE